MRKLILYFSCLWIAIVLISIILEKFDIYSNSLLVENIKNLLFGFAWIVPIILILLIRKKVIKYILLAVSAILIIFKGVYLFFLGVFLVNNLIDGNGYKQLFEKEISNNKYFSIYECPDESDFEGSNKLYAIDKKLPLGFVKRQPLNVEEYEFHQGLKNRTDIVLFGRDTISVDNKIVE